MIKRNVAERMIAAYPEMKYEQAQTYPIPKERSPNLYNLFDCIVDPETKTYLSEDFTFCHRWRKIGGKLWLDRETETHPYRQLSIRRRPRWRRSVCGVRQKRPRAQRCAGAADLYKITFYALVSIVPPRPDSGGGAR